MGPQPRPWVKAVVLAACLAALVLSPPQGQDAATAADQTCPASNPPNTLQIVSGTPQTAPLKSGFATPFQVTLANTDGCPLTSGVATPITFTAPLSGASGSFASSGSNSVTVGADASGSAASGMFTSNDLAGGYSVTASSAYGSVSFTLTNSAAGMPASVVVAGSARQSAKAGTRYAKPLSVRVLDASGAPVDGVTVTFVVGGGAGASGSGAGASATFEGGSAQATATTDTSGYATSPSLSANDTAGTVAASATVSGVATPARFSLRNRAGSPHTLSVGVAASESTEVGTGFQVLLAVTVTDSHGNPVSGARVTFTAPSLGPSGRFGSHRARRVSVRANAAGIAVAPRLVANAQAGGYVVLARAHGASAAAFALVNEAPGES